MKKYFLVAIILTFFGANAQIVNIPDANFKNRLLQSSSTQYIVKNLSGAYFKLDVNDDGLIQTSEAMQVSYMNVIANSISDLFGIESFINLKYLSCGTNQISNLNLSNLVNLITVNCSNNQLVSLNVSGLINLQNLVCSYNQLTSINVQGLTHVIQFNCGQNLLTTLDVSSLSNLTTLDCFSNNLISLNVKNGKYESSIGFTSNPTLQYVCADDFQVQNFIDAFISFGYTNAIVNSYCSFTPGGIYYSIQGYSKLDANANGCSSTDVNFPNLILNDYVNNYLTGVSISNLSGNYLLPVQSGIHTITPIIENPDYFNISPTSFQVDFPNQTSPFTQNFCISPNGTHKDLEVSIIPVIVARPGFDATYKLIYKNKGTSIQNGSIEMTFSDDKSDFISANPIITNQVGNILTWNYSDLQPFETREISFVINVNSPIEIPAVNSGDVLGYGVNIFPVANDELPLDNQADLKQIVVNSIDPNDKICIEGNVVGTQMIGEYVHYVIHFENTGTFAAQNIVVKDIIDLNKFDISTLVPIKGSHSFVTKINENKVEFIFENINLPFADATNDGYVSFKIKTLPTLTEGDTFTNQANIYFDYNFPITTNAASTTIQALANTDFEFETYFSLSPNPTNDLLNIHSQKEIQSLSISIYNALGQLVLVSTNPSNSIDVSSLKTGNYFIKIVSNVGKTSTKFIKQ